MGNLYVRLSSRSGWHQTETNSTTIESLPSGHILSHTTASLYKFNHIKELYSVGTRWKFGLLRGLNDVEPPVWNGKAEHEIPAGHASTISERALIPERRSVGRIIARDDGDAGSFPPGIHSRTGLDGGGDPAKGDPVGDANGDTEAFSECPDDGERGG